MRTKLLYGAIFAGLMAIVFAFATNTPNAYAAEAKNLKVFPKSISKKELKKVMKGIAEGLGVECDFCHDLDDMAKDTKHKETARAMMKMVGEINKKHFGGKNRVRCLTCHNGAQKPK